MVTNKNVKNKEKRHDNNRVFKQIRGIEPPSLAWEAGILPMNHICKNINVFIIQQNLNF